MHRDDCASVIGMGKRLSASRLNDFLGCSHHAALWLAGVQAPEEDNASLQLIRDKGFEHEARVLKMLEAIYGVAVSISDKAPLESRVAETLAAITNGAALIYQGALANNRWLGFADFLVRTGSGCRRNVAHLTITVVIEPIYWRDASEVAIGPLLMTHMSLFSRRLIKGF